MNKKYIFSLSKYKKIKKHPISGLLIIQNINYDQFFDINNENFPPIRCFSLIISQKIGT